MTAPARVALVGLGAGLARMLLVPSWRVTASRLNHRGRAVSLAGGPAIAGGASLAAAAGALAERAPRLAAAALLAGLGAGAVGYYDDVAGARPGHEAKGLAGHLGALRHGRITTGVVKLAGLGAIGLAAAAALTPPRRGRGPANRRAVRAPGARRVLDVALAAGVIAGTANALNLLDLRPGRALKAALALGLPLAARAGGGPLCGPLGAAAALLAEDLDEQIMLGDCGANALGAVIGVGLAARTGTAGRAGLVAGLAALTVASERVSFSAVIDATPGLREVDRLGTVGPHHGEG